MKYYSSCLLLTFYSFLFFTACSPRIYQPKPAEPVLLSKKNQLKINSISDINMSTISIAYSPKENFGIQMGVGGNHNETYTINNSGTKTSFLNEFYFNPYIAAGYYKLSNQILYEIYGGLGVYKYKNTARAYLQKMNNLNLFIQPSVAYVNKNFEVVFTAKIDNLNKGKVILSDSVLTAESLKNYNFLDYKSYFFFQPAITIKAGFKFLKFQLQISESIPFSNEYRSIYGLGYRFPFDLGRGRNGLIYGFGITAEIDNLFNQK
jgi:hypothetical protein